jgi:hypothetical protein
VEVEPPQEDLIWRQPQELVQRLPLIQQPIQLRVMLDVDLAEQSPPNDLPDEAEDEVLPTLGNVGRADVNDGAADTF